MLRKFASFQRQRLEIGQKGFPMSKIHNPIANNTNAKDARNIIVQPLYSGSARHAGGIHQPVCDA